MKPTIATLKGREFSLVNPDSAMVDIEEIAHALMNSVRWSGQSVRRFSVGQHSVMVYGEVCQKTADKKVRLAALLHDASEAYTGDISTPLSHALGEQWHEIKGRIEKAVFRAFNIDPAFYNHPLIKAADNFMYRWERNSFFPDVPWWPKFEDEDLPKYPIIPWDRGTTKQSFLNAFRNCTEYL